MDYTNIYDISLPLTENIIKYPSDPDFIIKEHCQIKYGAVCNVSTLSFGSHTGTHIDVPKHFYDNGLTLDQLSLDKVIGKAKVFDLRNRKYIGFNYLHKLPIEEGDRILFKTDNSKRLFKNSFTKDYTYLTSKAAQYLADKKVNLVGIDYLTIDSYHSRDYPAHYTLLNKNIIILEGINLSNIEKGIYTLIALPLNIVHGNGCPVRAVLLEK